MAILVNRRPHTHNFSGNPVHYELYSSLASVDATVFFEVKVMFRKLSALNYAEIVTLPYSPVNGYADIDLKDILDSLLEYALPSFNNPFETTVWDAAPQTGHFYLEFREITSGNPDPSWDDSEKDFERFVLKGGLNDFKYQGNNFWLNYFFVANPFLTWQQSGRLASYNERMYLAWLDLTIHANDLLKVKATVYYTDGTNDYVLISDQFSSSRKGAIYFIPAGAFQWDLENLNPAKTIEYWTIQVGVKNMVSPDPDAIIPLSEEFKYELDNRPDYISKTITYRNSLGGVDSVRARGSMELKAEYEYTELQKTIEPDYFNGHFFSPQKTVFNNTEQIVYSANIGHVTKEERDRLRDAQMIRDTWTCINKKWVPLCITTKNLTLSKSSDQRYHMPFEFTLGYTGSGYYTPESIDLGDGEFTENVCFAMISPLNVSVDISGLDAEVTIDGEEVDPQNASAQFRYRVIDLAGISVLDWQNANYVDLPLVFHIPKGPVYTLETQGICTNSVYGSKVTGQIDTAGGGGSGGPGGNSFVRNMTAIATSALLQNIDLGTTILNVNIGANNFHVFNYPTNGFIVQLRLTLGSLSPSSANLNSDGNSYNGLITGNIIDFMNVNINGGFQIFIH